MGPDQWEQQTTWRHQAVRCLFKNKYIQTDKHYDFKPMAKVKAASRNSGNTYLDLLNARQFVFKSRLSCRPISNWISGVLFAVDGEEVLHCVDLLAALDTWAVEEASTGPDKKDGALFECLCLFHCGPWTMSNWPGGLEGFLLNRSVCGMRYPAGLDSETSSCEQEFFLTLLIQLRRGFWVPEY